MRVAHTVGQVRCFYDTITSWGGTMRTSRIECSRLLYLPLLWPVRQSGAAVKHNDVILTLCLLSKQHVSHTPISHVSLERQLICDTTGRAIPFFGEKRDSTFKPLYFSALIGNKL